MSLLAEIQSSLMSEKTPLAPSLLKFKFLAARLKSEPLKEWISHELEGYPSNAPLPDYRRLSIAYRGTFSGPFGSGIKNAPIPSYLIEQFAGEAWTTFEMRQSIAAVDELISASDSSGVIRIDSSNLIIVLQGKIYEGYACNEVTGSFSVSQLTELQHVVRGRLLDLALEFEELPGASKINVGGIVSDNSSNTKEAATQIFHQTVYGTMQNVNNSGVTGDIVFNGQAGDQNALITYLTSAGIAETDAKDFAAIVSSETVEDAKEPFGQKAKKWLGENLKKAVDGTWKVGIATATEVFSKGALAYYGLD